MLIASAFWIFNKMQKQKGKANEHCINVMNIQEVNEQKPRTELKQRCVLKEEFSILGRIRPFER